MGDCSTCGQDTKGALASAKNILDGAQVMPGDLVRSSLKAPTLFGWVCCVTPESNEGHVYWQPHIGGPGVDSREPLPSLRCVDRALIPGDIVRRCDVALSGETDDGGGRDRDTMGMVVGTEVFLDLREVENGKENQSTQSSVPAATLRHLVPIRLASWVVHRADGWLGRMQSWDEDLVLRFEDASRCRLRAANQKQGVSIVESFYRDFFPGLFVTLNVQELRSGSLESEWLAGDLSLVLAELPSDSRFVEAMIEEVCVGVARVEWLTQVPLWKGWSTERPPKSDGCEDDKLIFLMGEAESSARWALGDRVFSDGVLAEVVCVETFLDVRWQDDVLSERVPSRELQLCNPDAFSFFPSELVCKRSLDEACVASACPGSGSVTPYRCATPITSARSRGVEVGQALADSVMRASGGGADRRTGTNSSCATAASVATGASKEDAQPLGYVVRADPASRMVCVRWLEENLCSEEEEWSAFDLQIDPEFGFRLGDAVIRCRDWEQSSRDCTVFGPRVGQVVALDKGSIHVRWLDGNASLHAPRELYRVGDEDEVSVAESQEGATSLVNGAERSSVANKEANGVEDAREAAISVVGESRPTRSGGEVPSATVAASVTTSSSSSSSPRIGGAFVDAVEKEESGLPQAESQPDDALVECTSASAPSTDPQPKGDDGNVSFEDMCWEPCPSDHHFLSCSTPSGAGNRQFSRRVQREWAILQQGLPRGVWVHIYPDRMELLRACLVGPEGTPYSDSLFFFDLHLPPTYPETPPQVRFWSFGENLNPNLYENGKVCLSLLGTWSGKDSETWSPLRSNLLQVLVSILGLVLNTEPYYNEPGFERERETPQGALRSQRYNESVALSSYHLILRVLRSPPVDFDRLARQHFAQRRFAILERARCLRDGLCAAASTPPPLANVAKGDPPAGEEVAVCSEGFKKSLAALIPRLEEALPQEAPPYR